MSKSLIGRILRALARDESTTPEDMEAAAKLAGSSDAEPRPQPAPAPAPAPAAPATPAPAAVPQPDNKPAAMDEATEARFKKIEDALEAISSKLNPAPPAAEPKKDALDALEEEIQNVAPATAPAGDEDDVIEPPEEINTQDAEPEEDVEGECAPNAKEARDAAMALIKVLKPAVAAISDEAKRKRAADSLAILIKGSMQQDAQYGELMQMRRRAIAKDSKPAVDDYNLGREIAKKYNPHYKNR